MRVEPGHTVLGRVRFRSWGMARRTLFGLCDVKIGVPDTLDCSRLPGRRIYNRGTTNPTGTEYRHSRQRILAAAILFECPANFPYNYGVLTWAVLYCVMLCHVSVNTV